MSIELQKVTSTTDIPTLTDLTVLALAPDPLIQWMGLYTSHSEHENTSTALTESMTDPDYRIVKAVLSTEQGDVVVGFVHWLCGYIQLEKVDPFAKREKGEEAVDVEDLGSVEAEEVVLGQAEELQRQHDERAMRLEIGASVYRLSRNLYISLIRGKRHVYVRRVMVHPEYQRRGIAAQMMKVITDEADELNICSWLYARPAGQPLYEKSGFRDVGRVKMDDDVFGFKCPDVVCMMRDPKPKSKP